MLSWKQDSHSRFAKGAVEALCRPEARGTGVGLALVEAAVAFGQRAGYHAMRLDTLPTMVAAQALYRQFGFRDVPPYRYNPVPGTSFMELVLGSSPSSIT